MWNNFLNYYQFFVHSAQYNVVYNIWIYGEINKNVYELGEKNLMRKSGAWILSTYCKLYVKDLQPSDFVRKDP
jgi:hypothetical protein